MSKKQQLKIALNEEKFGLPRSDPSLQIFQEKEIISDPSLMPVNRPILDQPMFQFIGSLPKLPKPDENSRKRKKPSKVCFFL